jgi:hypothetical protein
MEGFFDREVRSTLAQSLGCVALRIEDACERYFDVLSARFPADGSKIAWNGLPKARLSIESDIILQKERFLWFFDNAVSDQGLSGQAVYMGDSATEVAVIGDVRDIRTALSALLEMPQHHYVMEPSGEWVMCFSMEGMMGFAFAPEGN